MMERTLARNSISGINFVVCVLRYPSISLSLPLPQLFVQILENLRNDQLFEEIWINENYIGLKRFRTTRLNYKIY